MTKSSLQLARNRFLFLLSLLWFWHGFWLRHFPAASVTLLRWTACNWPRSRIRPDYISPWPESFSQVASDPERFYLFIYFIHIVHISFSLFLYSDWLLSNCHISISLATPSVVWKLSQNKIIYTSFDWSPCLSQDFKCQFLWQDFWFGNLQYFVRLYLFGLIV